MAGERSTAYVFVSYASADRERVLPVVDALTRAGIGVWMDREGISGGANYAEEITEAIKGAAAFVLMASAASLASRNVKQEIALAWRFERPYLPLLLEIVTIPDDLAYWLEASQWIEALDKPEREWLPSVLAALATLGVTPVASREEIRLAGREKELALLRAKLAATKVGNGGLVLIGGEAGIGKTTLAEVILREADRAGFALLEGHCFDLAETPPYGPWIDLFLRLPLSATPLPPAFAERGTVGAVPSQMALFAQVLDFLTALSSHRPVAMLLDDLHWSDPASLDLLRFLARSVAGLPLLILVTYRSDELTRRHPLYALLPQLAREAGAERLDLHRLDDDAVRVLVAERYHLPDETTVRLVTYLQSRAEGNALFVGELLRSLEEAGALRQEGEEWRLSDLAQAALPVLLRQVIDGRLGRLDDESQRLLAVAAVIGHEVPLAIWATVAEVNEEAVLTVAEEGLAAHLLVEGTDGESVRFTHALIREALYEGIAGIRRRRLHRQVGAALADGRNPDPDAVAYHFQQASDDRAAEWLIKAGERSEEAYALFTARARFEAALALVESDTTNAAEYARLLLRLAALHRAQDNPKARAYLDEARATAASEPVLNAYIALLSGLLHCFENAGNRGLIEMEEGVALLAALPAGERRRLASVPFSVRQALDEDGVGTLVLRLANAGRNAAAIARGEPVIATTPGRTAGGAGDPPRGDAYLGLGAAYAALGRPQEARRALQRAAIEHRAVGHHLLEAAAFAIELRDVHLTYETDDRNDRQRLHAALADAIRKSAGVWVGNIDSYDAMLYVEGRWEALRAAVRVWFEVSSVWRWFGERAAFLASIDGDTARAWQMIASELPDGTATAPGDGMFSLALSLQRTAVHLSLDEGDFPKAKAWLEAHDRWLAWSGAVLGQSEGQALWAQYYRAAGDPALAMAHAERALAHATEPRQPLALLAAHRLLGILDTDARRFEDADTHLSVSLALADACAAPYERALTLLAMAELRAAMGKTDAARSLVVEVKAICTPLGAKPTLARADALLTRLA
ncbi:MAG: AAA family ATPase [Thermomicrobiales bacterium]